MEPHLEPTGTAPLRQSPPPGVDNHPATLTALGERHMPTTAHFRREHFPVPHLDPAEWRLRLAGAVRTPAIITLADLVTMPQRSVVVVLECAGHRRAELVPATPGLQWGPGAVSEATWTGVPLRDLLQRAGVDGRAAEVVLLGADRGPFEGSATRHRYGRALPLRKALDPDTLLAFEMNGRPIPPEHGGPVRAIVPGWYATDSVKWLERVHVSADEFEGPFQAIDYRFATLADPGPGTRMERMPVNSLVTDPADAAALLPRGGPRPRDRVERRRRGHPCRRARRRRALEEGGDRRPHRAPRPHVVGARVGGDAGNAHDRRARPRCRRRRAARAADLEPAWLRRQRRPPRDGDREGGGVMGTFARDQAQGAGETFAADAALDAWVDAHDRGRELTREELEQLVRALAAQPDLWRQHVRHSPVERLYVRLHLDTHLEVWLICWSQRQDTGFHDHDRSRGAVSVVGGALLERRLAVGGPPPPTAIHPTGAAFSFGATHIHDVSQTGPGFATSLHVYSPPLGEMGFYEVAPDGTLGRRTGDYREEFC